MAPYHHIMAHFPMGLLFLGFWIIVARAVSDAQLVRRLDHVLPALLVIGLLGAVGTFITGLMIWPHDAITASPMGRNKLLFAAWAMAAWAVVALVRLRGGEEVWNTALRWPLVVLTLIAGGMLAITGTLGGYLLGSPSDFSVVLRLVGWDVYSTFYSPTWAIGVAGIVAVAIALLGRTAKR